MRTARDDGQSGEALSTFRGIDTLNAMTVIAELGDIRRFAHPRQLTSYVGLDIALLSFKHLF